MDLYELLKSSDLIFFTLDNSHLNHSVDFIYGFNNTKSKEINIKVFNLNNVEYNYLKKFMQGNLFKEYKRGNNIIYYTNQNLKKLCKEIGGNNGKAISNYCQ